MRCSQCGLPLSPTRNSSNCPRCGAPISNQVKSESASSSANALAPGNLPVNQVPPINLYTNINQSTSTIPEAANIYASPTPNWQNVAPSQVPFPDTQAPQMPFPSSEDWRNTPPSGPGRQINMQQPAWAEQVAPPVSYPTNTMLNQPGQPLARKPYPPARRQSKTTRIGFTVAALCIIAGGFLLVFVYFIGQGLLPNNGTVTTPAITQPSRTAIASQKPTPKIVPTPTTPAITPTPTLPGQGLLDISVLSSNFNEQTGQVIQQSASFQVNQRFYVVLSLHPGGSSHAVCLKWYLNDQLVNPYAFQVDPASNYNYYSYTAMHTAGTGRVEISLASTTNCTDAILAQKLSFTIS